MILRLLQVVTFFFVATVEVKVHAAEIISLRQDSQPLEEPAGCLDDGETCAIKTASGKKLEIELKSAVVTLGSGTSVIRAGTDARKNQITLVGGTALVKAEAPMFVESEFGTVIINHGEVIILKQEKKLITRVNRGEVFIQPRGFTSMIAVQPGEENWMSSVDKTGVAATGVSTSVNFADHTIIWSSLYSGKKRSFEKELKEFAKVWQQANYKVATSHADLAKRRIASIEADHQKRQAELEKRQSHEAQIRSLFRKKYLDQ